jgi:hypothetical protein
MMTKGDKRWIKNWKLKGVNMKPTKTTAAKRPAKKRPAKRKPLHGFKNELIAKLMNLKYRLNDAYNLRDIDTKDDKSYVISLINDVRDNHLTKLSREDMLKCNGLWRQYEG